MTRTKQQNVSWGSKSKKKNMKARKSWRQKYDMYEKHEHTLFLAAACLQKASIPYLCKARVAVPTPRLKAAVDALSSLSGSKSKSNHDASHCISSHLSRRSCSQCRRGAIEKNPNNEEDIYVKVVLIEVYMYSSWPYYWLTSSSAPDPRYPRALYLFEIDTQLRPLRPFTIYISKCLTTQKKTVAIL